MRKLLTVTLFSGLLTLFKMGSGFIVAKVVATYTGPSGIAMLGQVQSLVSVLNGIVTAPAGNGIVRYTSEYKDSGLEGCAPWWRAGIKWITFLLAIVIPIVCIFAKPISHRLFGELDYSWLVVLMALMLPLSAANSLVASIINGQHQYRRFICLGAVSVFVATIIMVVLVRAANLNGAMIAAALYTSISGMVMLIGSIRQPWFRLKYWWGKTDKAQIKGIGAYVAMAITSALTVPVSLLLVRNILVSQTGWEQTGQWQAVWKISEVYLGVITMALSTYFLPKLASLDGPDAILKEIKTTIRIIMPIVSLLALLVYLFRDIVISLIFTDAFHPAREFFAIQLVGDVIKIMSWIYAYPMLARGATKWFMGTEILFSMTFVLFAYIFVQKYGVHGANVAYALNYLIYLIFMYKNVRRFSY
ncbi:O-antigen translocase [Glaciimonas sp. GG7]